MAFHDSIRSSRFRALVAVVASAAGVETFAGTAFAFPGDISSGLIAHWTFDDPIDPWADGASGHPTESVCELSGGTQYCPTLITSGLPPIAGNVGALQLTGHGERLRVVHPASNSFNFAAQQPASLSLWLRRDENPSRCIYHVLGKRASCSGSACQTSTHFHMAWDCGSSGFGFGSCRPTPCSCTGNSVATNLPHDQWIHVAWVFDGSTARLYLGGFEQSVNPSFQWGPTNAANLVIGNSGGCAHATSFPGSIDDLRFYDRALDPCEIALLVNGATAARTMGEPDPCDVSFCLGDGSEAPCPCDNSGSPGRGCENSASTGGALLTTAGAADLSADTLVFTSSGERDAALTLFLQGTTEVAAVGFGDGLRCVAGTLKRLYVKNAVGGIATAPTSGDPSVSARSSVLGDTILGNGVRYYMAYYRDPSANFCPEPAGSAFNSSTARRVVWVP